MDRIFDDGTFENARRPMVILVEGALGSGKTNLAPVSLLPEMGRR